MLLQGATLQERYHIDRVLGRGGMGTVYQAQDQRLDNKTVAVKELENQQAPPDMWQMSVRLFLREARILATLDHPGLVRVTDCFEEAGSAYLVMDLVGGETLTHVLNGQDGPIAVTQAVEWARQMADILGYLHGHQPPVILRDIKPDNVMVQSDGRIRLIDFGLARFFRPEGSAAMSTMGVGTPGFAPVEQYGDDIADARSDIYAFGATVYSLLTREIPPQSVLRGLGPDALVPPSTINPEVSPRLEAVILKMMAVRREDRFPTIQDVSQALGRLDAADCPRCGKPPDVTTGRCGCQPAPGRRVPRPAAVGLGALVLLPLILLLHHGTAALQPIQLRPPVDPSHPAPVQMAAFIPGDQHLVTASDNVNSYEVWDVPTRRLAETRPGRVYRLSPDGRVLYAGFHSRTLDLLDFETSQTIKEVDPQGVVEAAEFSPDSQSLLTVPGFASITLWNAQTGDIRAQWGTVQSDIVTMAWAPDGQVVATGDTDDFIKVWTVDTGTPTVTATGATQIRALAWSADSHQLASGDSHGQLIIWDRSGTRLHSVVSSGDPVTAVAFSPVGKEMASGDGRGRVTLWQTESWTPQYHSPPSGDPPTVGNPGFKHAVTTLTWSHDGRWLVAGRQDGSLDLWPVH